MQLDSARQWPHIVWCTACRQDGGAAGRVRARIGRHVLRRRLLHGLRAHQRRARAPAIPHALRRRTPTVVPHAPVFRAARMPFTACEQPACGPGRRITVSPPPGHNGPGLTPADAARAAETRGAAVVAAARGGAAPRQRAARRRLAGVVRWRGRAVAGTRCGPCDEGRGASSGTRHGQRLRDGGRGGGQVQAHLVQHILIAQDAEARAARAARCPRSQARAHAVIRNTEHSCRRVPDLLRTYAGPAWAAASQLELLEGHAAPGRCNLPCKLAHT